MNKTPNRAPLGLCSLLLQKTPPSLPATPPLSPCSLGPIFLFPVSSQAPYHSSTRPVALSVRPTTSPRSPSITSHTPTFRQSHQSYKAWQPSNHHRPASLGSRCHRASTGLSLRIPPIPDVWFSFDEPRYGHQRRTTIRVCQPLIRSTTRALIFGPLFSLCHTLQTTG